MKNFLKKYRILLFPGTFLLIMLLSLLFVIDTPLNLLSKNWMKIEGTVVELKDNSDINDDAEGRIFFRKVTAVIKYVNIDGDSTEGYLREYDNFYDRILHPVDSKMTILYNKKTGALANIWMNVLFKYSIFAAPFLLIGVLWYIFRRKKRRKKNLAR